MKSSILYGEKRVEDGVQSKILAELETLDYQKTEAGIKTGWFLIENYTKSYEFSIENFLEKIKTLVTKTSYSNTEIQQNYQ